MRQCMAFGQIHSGENRVIGYPHKPKNRMPCKPVIPVIRKNQRRNVHVKKFLASGIKQTGF